MAIETGTHVTKKGDSIDNPEIGTVIRTSSNRAEVDWGWTKAWETINSLRPIKDKP